MMLQMIIPSSVFHYDGKRKVFTAEHSELRKYMTGVLRSFGIKSERTGNVMYFDLIDAVGEMGYPVDSDRGEVFYWSYGNEDTNINVKIFND